MSVDPRSTRSALFKRAEQLKRWEESDTNRESGVLNGESRKIKFSAGCVFLAACAAGDKEEVLSLINKGVDIDTTNVDGLSALHQACIDDNLDMVEFLVENGADVNKGDNEGWTPLHATASCGFISIAKYLIEMGANVAAVNHDGELPVDIAESDEMEDMLQQIIDDRGIDAESARNEEQRIMMEDAKNWLQRGRISERLHPKSGATSLHVAAAKGYNKVMEILLEAGSDIDAQDNDGWTPLHAAAHWGQKEAARILVEHFCDMDTKNYVGQTAYDVADSQLVPCLEELRKKQSNLSRDNFINKKKNNNNIQPLEPMETCKSRISERIKTEKDDDVISELKNKVPEVPPLEVQSVFQSIQTDQSKTVRKNSLVKNEPVRTPPDEVTKQVPTAPAPSLPPKGSPVEDDESGLPSWRRTVRTREDAPKFNLPLRISDREELKTKPETNAVKPETSQEVVLRRTQSFEADEKFYRRYLELRAKINANNKEYTGIISSPARSASLKEKHFARRGQVKEDPRAGSSSLGTTPTVSMPSVLPPTPLTLQSGIVTATPATIYTPPLSSPSPLSSPQHTIRRSFVPPVRDEESETQRKAHAKRVRETRRSTQGVTLEEIKSAEQLVKKKQQEAANAAVVDSLPTSSESPATTTITATTTTTTTTVTSSPTSTVTSLSTTTTTTSSSPTKRSSISEGGVVADAVFTFTSQRRESPPEASLTLAGRRGSAAERLAATVASANDVIDPRLVASGNVDSVQDRRPSWKLKVNNGNKLKPSAGPDVKEAFMDILRDFKAEMRKELLVGMQNLLQNLNTKLDTMAEDVKFMLEDARSTTEQQERSKSMLGQDHEGKLGVSKAPTETAETTVTLPLWKNRVEDREQDKENDARSGQATQGVIQRRRRPKRRSTGVVHVDMDEIDPDRTAESGEGCLSDGDSSPRVNSIESEKESEKDKSEPSSRVSPEPTSHDQEASENGEIDYKKLYEESQLEIGRLKEKIKKTEDDLARAKLMSEKVPYVPMRNSLSEAEKREKRAMERKLAEMEEELKQLEQLKCENQKLKDEKGALIRVLSKLSK